MDVGVEAKGRPGISVTPARRAGFRRRGLIRPRNVTVCSLLLFTIKTIPKKKKKKKKDQLTAAHSDFAKWGMLGDSAFQDSFQHHKILTSCGHLSGNEVICSDSNFWLSK